MTPRTWITVDGVRHALGRTEHPVPVPFTACGVLLDAEPPTGDDRTVPYCPHCLRRAQARHGRWQVTEHGAPDRLVHFVDAATPPRRNDSGTVASSPAWCGTSTIPAEPDALAGLLLCPVCTEHALVEHQIE